MRDDIYGGLRNALDRGISLEQAIKSFTNAGYPESEVREAALALQKSMVVSSTQAANTVPQPKPSFMGNIFSRAPQKAPSFSPAYPTGVPQTSAQLSSSASSPTAPPKSMQSTQVPMIARKQPAPVVAQPRPVLTSFEVGTPKDHTTALIIVFSVILLLSVLALVGSILFKDSFAEIINSLF